MSTAPAKKPLSDATKLRRARRDIRELKQRLVEARAELAALGRGMQDFERTAHRCMHAYDALLKAGNGAVNYLPAALAPRRSHPHE